MITQATLEDALVLAEIFTRAETIYKTKKTIPWAEAILEAVNAQAPEPVVTEVKEPWFSDKEVQDYLSSVRNSSALHPVPPCPPMPFRYAQISSHDVYTFSQVQRLLILFTDAMFVFRDSLKEANG